MTLYNGMRANEQNVVVTAIVTSNDDPEKRGRIKLKYHWGDDSVDSNWVRVATIGAGKGYGFYFVPEVGDEVLVAFIDGDVERPVVIGSLWNGKDKPFEGSKPVEKWVRTKGENSLVISDEESNGHITISTANGHVINISDEAGSEKITISDESGNNGVEIDITNKEMKITSEMKLSLQASMIEIVADMDMQIKSNGTLAIEGTLVTIN